MEKKSRIQQVYGYAVCLVAIITLLISLSSLITSIIDASDPLYSMWGGDKQDLSSFENFKMDVLKSGQQELTYKPDDATLQRMYEDAKIYKIKKVKHRTTKSIIVDSIIIFVCTLLFVIHWRWMRKLARQEV